MGKLIQRLDTGLSTLRKTALDVAELQVDLKQTMIRVDEKKSATEALLVQMGQQRKEAEDQQAIAELEAQKAAKCVGAVRARAGGGGGGGMCACVFVPVCKRRARAQGVRRGGYD